FDWNHGNPFGKGCLSLSSFCVYNFSVSIPSIPRSLSPSDSGPFVPVLLFVSLSSIFLSNVFPLFIFSVCANARTFVSFGNPYAATVTTTPPPGQLTIAQG